MRVEPRARRRVVMWAGMRGKQQVDWMENQSVEWWDQYLGWPTAAEMDES